MIEVIPAILTSDPKEIYEKLKICEDSGVSRIQIDIIDGKYAANKTIDPLVLKSLDTTLNLDFHLMTLDPVNWVERCVGGGAERIIGQIEKMGSQVEFVGKVEEVGAKIGLAIDLDTPVSSLDPVVLTNLDVVLVMAVKAGFGGQKFDRRVLDKIKELDEIRGRDNTPFRICVDGGEVESTIDDTHFAGADEVVIGRRIFEGDLRENVERFQKAAHELGNGLLGE